MSRGGEGSLAIEGQREHATVLPQRESGLLAQLDPHVRPARPLQGDDTLHRTAEDAGLERSSVVGERNGGASKVEEDGVLLALDTVLELTVAAHDHLASALRVEPDAADARVPARVRPLLGGLRIRRGRGTGGRGRRGRFGRGSVRGALRVAGGRLAGGRDGGERG